MVNQELKGLIPAESLLSKIHPGGTESLVLLKFSSNSNTENSLFKGSTGSLSEIKIRQLSAFRAAENGPPVIVVPGRKRHNRAMMSCLTSPIRLIRVPESSTTDTTLKERCMRGGIQCPINTKNLMSVNLIWIDPDLG